MIKGESDYLTKLAAYNLCADHKSLLVVAWHAGDNAYVLRCGEDHYPDTLVRKSTLTEEYKRSPDVREPAAANLKRRAEAQATGIVYKGENDDWWLVPTTDLGSGETLSAITVHRLIKFALKYHLDPMRGHVVLMYGKPYITIDGYLYYANFQKISYTLTTRPLTDPERKTYLIPDGAHAWVSEIIDKSGEQSVIGLGVVTQEEMTELAKGKKDQLKSPVVAKHPWNMAQKRAEWQALRRAFPIGRTSED